MALRDQSVRSPRPRWASSFVKSRLERLWSLLGYSGGQNRQAPLYGLLNGFSRLSSRSVLAGAIRPRTVGGDGSGWTDVLVRLTMSKQHPVEPEPEGEDHKHEN